MRALEAAADPGIDDTLSDARSFRCAGGCCGGRSATRGVHLRVQRALHELGCSLLTLLVCTCSRSETGPPPRLRDDSWSSGASTADVESHLSLELQFDVAWENPDYELGAFGFVGIRNTGTRSVRCMAIQTEPQAVCIARAWNLIDRTADHWSQCEIPGCGAGDRVIWREFPPGSTARSRISIDRFALDRKTADYRVVLPILAADGHETYVVSRPIAVPR